MKPKISMITLGVKDLKRATEFYNKGLNLPVDDSFDGVSFFKLNGAWLSLFPIEELKKDAGSDNETLEGFPGFTLAHNVGSKNEVDDVINEARKAGAKITDEPHDRDWGGYSGYFEDLDGYLWEIAWNPHFEI